MVNLISDELKCDFDRALQTIGISPEEYNNREVLDILGIEKAVSSEQGSDEEDEDEEEERFDEDYVENEEEDAELTEADIRKRDYN